MPVKCSATGCISKTEDIERAEFGTTFHRFPKNPSMLKRWLENLGRDNFIPGNRTKLCSRHFTNECFQQTSMRVRLKHNAIPTIFEGRVYSESLAHGVPRKPTAYFSIEPRSPEQARSQIPEVDENEYKQILKTLEQPESMMPDPSSETDNPHQKDPPEEDVDQNEQGGVVPQSTASEVSSPPQSTAHSSKEPGSSKKPKSSKKTRCQIAEEDENGYGQNSGYVHDHGYCSAPFVKRKLEDRQAATAKKLKVCQQRCRRLERRIDSLSSIILELVSAGCADLLEQELGGVVKKSKRQSKKTSGSAK